MSAQDHRVTVVIPHFEAADTVRSAVDSVLAQTYRDFSLLVIDDGSSVSPVPSDLPDDPRISVERLPENRGYAGVTNHAVRMARSEWVTFVDADDTIEPTYLERLVAAAESSDADVVFTPMLRISGPTILPQKHWAPPGRASDARAAMRGLLRGDLLGTQHLLLRRPRPVAREDYVYSDFLFVMAEVARARRVAYVDEALYRYTVHQGSTTGSLRESVRDLMELPSLTAPLVDSAFGPEEAEPLKRSHLDVTRTHILHAAANEPRNSPLRREVMAWCRQGITPRGILRQLAEGRRFAAVSWALALISPSLHGRIYRMVIRRRDRA